MRDLISALRRKKNARKQAPPSPNLGFLSSLGCSLCADTPPKNGILAEMAAQPLFEHGVGKVVLGREELFTAEAQDDGMRSRADGDEGAGRFVRPQFCRHLRDLQDREKSVSVATAVRRLMLLVRPQLCRHLRDLQDKDKSLSIV